MVRSLVVVRAISRIHSPKVNGEAIRGSVKERAIKIEKVIM